MIKKLTPLLIVVVLSILSSLSLLHAGFPPTHDGEYHVIRFYEFDKAIRDGDWYPRWASDLQFGYGVPLFNFVYPLPNYVAFLLHAGGVSFIDAVKVNMLLATLVGGVFFYLWAKEFWGKIGGVISSVLYTFSPYHFLDIYVRGSVGEVWALAFFPAFLWSFTKLVNTRKKIFIVFSSIFLALIIFSHNILAVMFVPFAIVYMGFIACIQNRKAIKEILYIFCLGISLSAIFWLPALFEKKYTVGLQINSIGDHFPDLFQLLIPSWGTGFSGGSLQNQMSLQIGVANLLAVIAGLCVLFVLWKRKDLRYKLVTFLIVWFIAIFYLMLSFSRPIWDILPFFEYFQFPWRFLSIEILICSLLGGSIVVLFENEKKDQIKSVISKVVMYSVVILIVVLIIFATSSYTKPAYYMMRSDSYYTTRSNFIYGTNSVGNVFNTVWVDKENFILSEKEKATSRAQVLSGEAKITTNNIKNSRYNFDISVASPNAKIAINTMYFPGWNVYVNGSLHKVDINRHGFMEFILTRGVYKVDVLFEDTIIRKISLYISALSGMLLLAIFFVTIKDRKEKNENSPRHKAIRRSIS